MCVVIGILVVLIALYWLFYGHRFEGPVSRSYSSKCSLAGSNSLCQKFDVILGEQAESIITNSRRPTDDKEKGVVDHHG